MTGLLPLPASALPCTRVPQILLHLLSSSELRQITAYLRHARIGALPQRIGLALDYRDQISQLGIPCEVRRQIRLCIIHGCPAQLGNLTHTIEVTGVQGSALLISELKQTLKQGTLCGVDTCH